MPERLATISSRADQDLIVDAEEAGSIDQLQHAGKLFLGKVCEEVLLDCHIGTDVAALGRVEPVRVIFVRNGCDEGIDDRGQCLPLWCTEFDGHGMTFRAWRGCDQAERRGGAREAEGSGDATDACAQPRSHGDGDGDEERGQDKQQNCNAGEVGAHYDSTFFGREKWFSIPAARCVPQSPENRGVAHVVATSPGD